MKKNHFSLIELLCAMAVIAVLMGILIPTVGKIREKGKVTKARAEINAIVTAIKSYESTYGLLPAVDGDLINSTTDQLLNNGSGKEKYDKLMTILTQSKGPAGEITDGNIRKINFLDIPSQSKYTTEGYTDPWGNRYMVAIDTDYNNEVTIAGCASCSPNPLKGAVFVYSYGPDKKDNNGSTTDDICSWK